MIRKGATEKNTSKKKKVSLIGDVFFNWLFNNK